MENSNNVDEIQSILEKMGKLLSPDCSSSENNLVYQSVLESSEHKTIEEILNEARDLVKETTPLFECLSVKDSSEQDSEQTDMEMSKSRGALTEENLTKHNHSMLQQMSNKKAKITQNVTTNSPEPGISTSVAPVEVSNSNKQTEPHTQEILRKQVDEINLLKLRLMESSNMVEEYRRKYEQCKKERDKYCDMLDRCKIDNSNYHQMCEQLMRDKIDINNKMEELRENLKKKEHLLENQRKNDECKRSVLKLDIISNELPNFESKNRLLTPIYETGKQVNTLMEKESPKIENSNDIDELLSQFRNLEESKRKLEMELKQCKESFKKREAMLIKDNWHLKVQAQNACRNVPPQIEMLQEKLKDAEEKIVSLTLDYEAAKGNAYELDKLCKKLSNTITKLETSKAEESRLNSPSSRSIMLRSPSSRAQTPSNEEFYRSPKSYKQDYSYMEMEHYSSIDDMERIKELKKSLELMSESLSKEKKVTCELSREIEQMHKENIDYKRQVKELENILKKRLQTNSLAFLGKWENEDFIPSHVKDRLKKYEDELAEKESLILTLRRQLSNIETRYETRLEFIEKEVMEYKEENRKLQDELNSKKNAINSNNNNSKCKRKCQQQASDSYLIATIRGYKTDLSTKDKEISLLKKQIEESSKKVNGKQTLMPQREHGKSKQKLQNNEELITDKIKRMEKELLGVTEMENSEKELKKKNVEATIQDESKMKNVLIHQLPDIKVHSPSHTK